MVAQAVVYHREADLVARLLNEALYSGLVSLYGDVKVMNPGDPGDFKKVTLNKNGKTYTAFQLPPGGRRGERYRFRCPFCHDHTPRCYVDYVFGIDVSGNGYRNIFSWHCFNEDCSSDRENCQQLYDDLEPYIYWGVSTSDIPVGYGEARTQGVSIGPSAVVPRICPGVIRRLVDIGESDWLFPAIKYLRDDRGFDVVKLHMLYDVGVVSEPYYDRRIKGRIYTPFHRSGYRVGWNARAVPGFSENGADKYINSTGGLSGICYGLLGAIATKVVVIVEGVTDKWAVGVNGVAVLGKKLNHSTIMRLISELSQSSVDLVIVLLDPEKSSDDIKHNREHHSIVAQGLLKKYWSGPVEVLMLPGGDPADTGGNRLANFLSNELKVRGYDGPAEIVGRAVCMSTACRE